ncbi:MAG: Glutamate--tRNA ligase mitochondrial [Bogoriella megaspora]|nr:MAG: Glutamate--tRNA ligase mitochondrial [Bogoriella megaspora]
MNKDFACSAPSSATKGRTSTDTFLRLSFEVCPPQKSRSLLPDNPARTRFAPSPTGYLHLGSLRTALFSYLLARATKGQFILRLEDTDQTRTVPGAEARLYEDIKWAGLHWDEGPEIGGPFGPYRQSDRTQIYQKHASDLRNSGHAYRCFCSKGRIESLSRYQHDNKLAVGYDRNCEGLSPEESYRRAAAGETHVIRLRSPNVAPVVEDMIFGKVQSGWENDKRKYNANVVWEDPVLLKSDGMPTYHLANVVDDHLMNITHVIRGSEWLPSTSRHVALYNAFGWEPPVFAHVGLLVDSEGQKLSKRNSGVDTDIKSYREKGYLPESLINFVSLLGWSHREKKDFMDMEKLVDVFGLKFTKGNTTVNFGKLAFLQKQHAAVRARKGGPPFDEMVDRVTQEVESTISPDSLNLFLNNRNLRDYVAQILRGNAKNYETPTDFVQRNYYFFKPLSETASFQLLVDDLSEDERRCILAASRLGDIPNDRWRPGYINDNIGKILDTLSNDFPMSSDESFTIDVADKRKKEWQKQFNLMLREMLTGGLPGPGLGETMAILGKDIVMQRLDKWIDVAMQTRDSNYDFDLPPLLSEYRQKQLEPAALADDDISVDQRRRNSQQEASEAHP